MKIRHDHAELEFVKADWPAPPPVHALTTTRGGGCSAWPFDSLNLATHVGDEPQHVSANRARLRTALRLPTEPIWLEQTHSSEVIAAGGSSRRADGIHADKAGIVCAILTADCMPVLLCDRQGTEICALHAGWRGLASGIIARGVARMRSPAPELLAWLGPAIGAAVYEVGIEVRDAFLRQSSAFAAAFQPSRPEHFYCDLYRIGRLQLAALGVNDVHGGAYCTFTDKERFFSYRRDGGAGRDTGRMATLLWLQP